MGPDGEPIAELRMLNVGGGFSARHEPKPLSIADIAAAIKEGLKELPYIPRKLAIEPGRGMIGDFGTIGATALGVFMRNGRRIVHLDLGFTLAEPLESRFTIDYSITDSRGSAQRERSDLFAGTCDSQDLVVENDGSLSVDLTVGDVVFIGTTGAYSNYGKTFNGLRELAIQHPLSRRVVSLVGHERLNSATYVQIEDHLGTAVAHGPAGFGVMHVGDQRQAA